MSFKDMVTLGNKKGLGRAQRERDAAKHDVHGAYADQLAGPMRIAHAERRKEAAQLDYEMLANDPNATESQREAAQDILVQRLQKWQDAKERYATAPHRLEEAQERFVEADRNVKRESGFAGRYEASKRQLGESGLGQMGGGFRDALGRDTVSGAAQSIAGGVTKAGEAIGGPGGAALQIVGKFGEELAGSVDRLREWGKQLHDNNMQFAEFSASMSKVRAETEIWRIGFERQRGENRAESAGELAKANQRLAENLAPMDDAWNKFRNNFAKDLQNLTSATIEGMAKLFGGKPDTSQKGQVSLAEWAEHVEGEYEKDVAARRPAQFPSNPMRPRR